MDGRSHDGLGIRNFKKHGSAPDDIQLLDSPLAHPLESSTYLLEDPQKSKVHYSKTPVFQCISHNKERHYRTLPYYLVIPFILSGIYSTVGSGVWLAVAIHKPHWGTLVYPGGGLITYETAGTLTTALAKTIEMSFVSFYLATVGQYLTRRASNYNVPGISLADLQLKILLLTPGTLLTILRRYRSALKSVIGIASLIACLSSVLYITASESLGMMCLSRPYDIRPANPILPNRILTCLIVSPKPSTLSGKRQLYGNLQTSPANKAYVGKNCPATGDNGAVDTEQCMVVTYGGEA